MKHVFIINPQAGNGQLSRKIRRTLEELKTDSGFDYLAFDSEYQGHESILADKICSIFSDEPLRFYACGGSGTLQRTISGIPELSGREIACCPTGLTNDLIKCFGMSSYADFRDLKKLIGGSTVPLDVIRINGEYRAANSLTIGFESCFRTFSFFQDLSMINRNLPYKLMPVITILTDTSAEYEITVDGRRYDGRYVVLHFANGKCFGSNMYPLPYARPNDGRLEIMLFKAAGRLNVLRSLKPFRNGDLESIGDKAIVTDGSEIRIRRADRKPIIANLDGEAVEFTEINASLERKKLNFVVPAGVTLDGTDKEENK